jgi:hypothetical protein
MHLGAQPAEADGKHRKNSPGQGLFDARQDAASEGDAGDREHLGAIEFLDVQARKPSTMHATKHLLGLSSFGFLVAEDGFEPPTHGL